MLARRRSPTGAAPRGRCAMGAFASPSPSVPADPPHPPGCVPRGKPVSPRDRVRWWDAPPSISPAPAATIRSARTASVSRQPAPPVTRVASVPRRARFAAPVANAWPRAPARSPKTVQGLASTAASPVSASPSGSAVRTATAKNASFVKTTSVCATRPVKPTTTVSRLSTVLSRVSAS